MYIITVKYQGRIYQRRITRKQGFYVMESKGEQYWFGKDISKSSLTHGWHIVNGKVLPSEFMQLISDELERFFVDNKK